MAESILTLYKDAALREQMGRLGRQYTEAHYSRRVAVVREDELLRQVADRK